MGPGFAYDNERPAYEVTVGGFRLGRVPVTNGDWLEFIREGGYGTAEHWSAQGWSWRCEEEIEHPGGWVAPDGPVDSPQTHIHEWRIGGREDLVLDKPVVHVSFHEAEAFARARGLRLPTEAEWGAGRHMGPRAPGQASGPLGRSPRDIGTRQPARGGRMGHASRRRAARRRLALRCARHDR